MKFFCYSIFLFLFPFLVHSQAGEWTWMKGANTFNDAGSYGTRGVPSASNEPHARYACAYWTDTAGNFWIYGGFFYSGCEDLWKFDPLTLEWVWMNGDATGNTNTTIAAPKGQYASANTPGDWGFGMFTWVTNDNHLWLFGGRGYDDNSDLWQYDPAINQWAWMGNFGPVSHGTKGIGNSTTMPGGRSESTCAWTDGAGNLWLFGGDQLDSIYKDYNDMWKYDILTGIWTWMSGSDNYNDSGAYGIRGVPSVNNYPGGRSATVYWKDEAGNFWIAGGYQWQKDLWYQDIWKFNPSTLEWTWVAGPSSTDSSAPVGVVCQTGDSVRQGSLYENRAVWKICDNLILNYGGFSTADYTASENDLWALFPLINKWEKVAFATSNYGAQGVASPLNYPLARYGRYRRGR